MKTKLRKLVFAALFAALTCAATIIVQIPAPMNGYLNLGDCFVLLSGFILGPAYGFCAAGIGSALADGIVGYGIYAPASFIIKGAVAVITFYLFKIINKTVPKYKRTGRVISSIAAELFMVFGYFLYALLIFRQGLSAAVATVPGNLLQGAVAIAAFVLLFEALGRIKYINTFIG